jgi:hypothetical protein
MTFGQDTEEPGPPLSSARVRRAVPDGAPPALCADINRQAVAVTGTSARQGRAVTLSLTGDGGSGFPPNDFARTRCAGPTVGDVAGTLPVRTITERALLHGRGKTIDFSVDEPFSSGGLSGTVHSTLKLRIGKAVDLLEQGRDQLPQPTHRIRLRQLEVSYRIDRFSGQVVTTARGLDDPDLCGPLDSCGLMGTVSATPRVATGEGYLIAVARIRHSKQELRRAVGLAPGGRPRGVETYGVVYWDQTAGHVASDLRRDGADPCTDTQALSGPGAIELAMGKSTVHAHFGSDFTAPAIDPLRTRCPGPGIGDVAGGRLAGGALPLTAFGRRVVTLRLTHGGPYAADGYRGATRADMTVVLRRVRIRAHVQVIRVPIGVSRLLFRIGR